MNPQRHYFSYVFYLFFVIAPLFLRADVAYVANPDSNTVSVIDITTNTVIDTISGTYLISPYQLAITPDSRFVYVTSEDYVVVIDTASNDIVANIFLGTLSNIISAVAITPNGNFAYVTNQTADSVYVINTATNTVVSSIAVGNAPIAIAFTPDGNFAYVPNYEGDTVSVISTASNTVVATIVTGPVSRPVNVAITPDGLFAYVTGQTSPGNVFVINTATNNIDTTIAAVGNFPTGIAISPNGYFAYVANFLGANIAVINTTLNSVVDTISVPISPFQIVITPDGASAYVTQIVPDGTVSKINLTTNLFTGISIPVGAAPDGIALARIINAVSNLTGQQKTEDFGVEYQKYNVLQWLPSSSTGIVTYQVFRNGVLIATLDSSAYKYIDNNVKKHSAYTYSIVAIDGLGNKSAPQSVTITWP